MSDAATAIDAPALKPVSFKKGRGHQPRLSAPYVPGVRHERYWTEAEHQILRDHYPTKGFAFCAELMPKRSRMAIYGEAKKLGLGREGRQAHRKHGDMSGLDEAIRTTWPEIEPGHGMSHRLAERLGKPRWLVSKRLIVLGLAHPQKKQPNWTPAEDELMQSVPLHDPDRAREIFLAHGFNRTATSIVIRAKRLNLSRRFKDGLSATAAGRILGLDTKSITSRIVDGRIKADRRGSRRLIQQGGDWHVIQAEELRRFVIEHVAEIDFRRVDKFALVELLTGGAKQDHAAALPAAPAAAKRRLIQPRRRQPRVMRRVLERMAERRA